MSFQFKQFSVDDSRCAMKIGTDGCLLGAWADVSGAEKILEIGTGSGVVAMMLAQRSNATIDTVEIDTDAYKQATDNFIRCPWTGRLKAFHTSIQEYVKSCKTKYDIIVSSPPYFADSLKTKDHKRRLARHTDSLSFQELVSCAKRLLNDDGRFCVIIPSESAENLVNTALIEGLYKTSILQIRPKVDAEIIRSLIQFELQKLPTTSEELAILEADGKGYTNQYQQLTNNYYIIF